VLIARLFPLLLLRLAWLLWSCKYCLRFGASLRRISPQSYLAASASRIHTSFRCRRFATRIHTPFRSWRFASPLFRFGTHQRESRLIQSTFVGVEALSLGLERRIDTSSRCPGLVLVSSKELMRKPRSIHI